MKIGIYVWVFQRTDLPTVTWTRFLSMAELSFVPLITYYAFFIRLTVDVLPAYQITGNLTVCSKPCTSVQRRKHQIFTLLTLCWWNPSVNGGFSSHWATNAENVSMMETFSALVAQCEENPPLTDGAMNSSCLFGIHVDQYDNIVSNSFEIIWLKTYVSKECLCYLLLCLSNCFHRISRVAWNGNFENTSKMYLCYLVVTARHFPQHFNGFDTKFNDKRKIYFDIFSRSQLCHLYMADAECRGVWRHDEMVQKL